MDTKSKVLLINPFIPEYRFPIFNILANYVELTILHSGKEISKPGINFKQMIMPLNRIGPFTLFNKNIHKICSNYEIVISEANIRHIDRNLLIINPFRKYKWISWGIGVSASYEKKFDEQTSLDLFRYWIFKRADANVFYSEYPIKKYLKAGFKHESLFVASNTTQVEYNEDMLYTRDKILFVGTLYKQKKIYQLLNSYLNVYQALNTILPLHIIGEGDEFENIHAWITENNLNEKIFLHGAIFDQKILEKFFRESYACISPGQAGLSVLTSMGYGTPYVTMKNAITGGEIFNIENGITGVLYEKENELDQIIKDICTNSQKFENMGMNARQFYQSYRTPYHMVKGFLDAINFVKLK